MDWKWSNRVEQADWVAARQPADAQVCTVPTGFAAYARVLHPIEPSDPDPERPAQVRWAQVARWSGVPLGPQSQFWQIALPRQLPQAPVPGEGAPASDVLGGHDGRALARLLRSHTATPEECWFGIWDGYGWGPYAAVRVGSSEPVEPPMTSRDPVPRNVREGPRVHLPGRDYLLYTGPVEAGLAFLPGRRELADLWWPADRAWFVYGDVDLNATYVAGSAQLVEALVDSAELEALPANSVDPVLTWPGDVPAWLSSLIEAAVSELLSDHGAELVTSRFTATFTLQQLEPPRPPRRNWDLRYAFSGPSRSRGGSWLSDNDLPDQLRREILMILTDHLEG